MGDEEKLSEAIDISDIKTTHSVEESPILQELRALPKWKLEHIISSASKVRKDKYIRDRVAKYGNLPRCFNSDQLELFFRQISNEEHKFFFILMFFFALRIGEVSRVSYIPEQLLLRIKNPEKSSAHNVFLPVPPMLHKYLKSNLHFFRCGDEKGGSQLNSNYMAKLFRRYRDRAKLRYVYDYASDGRPLVQFSSHTLRHTAINTVGVTLRDPYKICQFSRHSSETALGVMATYRYYGLDKMRVDLDRIWEDFYFLLL